MKVIPSNDKDEKSFYNKYNDYNDDTPGWGDNDGDKIPADGIDEVGMLYV